MKYKGKEFENDIKALKQLAAKRKKNFKKYKQEYLALKKTLADKYNVGIRSIERWVVVKSPWVRDTRSDIGIERNKLPTKTKKMLHDAIDSGLTKKNARQVVAAKTGSKIHQRKADKALMEEINDKTTSFGSEAKEFFKKLFELDLIPPDKGLKYIYKKESFIITKSDLQDICRILANAYNRYCDAPSKLQVDRGSMRRAKIWQMYDEAVTLINNAGVSVKDLKEISLFIQRLDIDRNKINPRVITFFKVSQHFKPDVTLDEVISLCEEYEGVYD